jgi:hypothetical protein
LFSLFFLFFEPGVTTDFMLGIGNATEYLREESYFYIGLIIDSFPTFDETMLLCIFFC